MKRLIYTPIILIALLTLFSFNNAHSQYCDSLVPSFNVDLSASPVMSWVSPPIVRDGSCCGSVAPDVCLEFIITLHPSTIALNFNIASGAVPPGALYYQIDCGPPIAVGDPICLYGPGPHTLTFCKPGNNGNTFSIQTYGDPYVGPDITLNAGCQGYIYGVYYDETTINWTSIAPGPVGAYDNLLSCTSSCDTTYVTAPVSGPPYVDYLVCGADVPGCNPNLICDTVRVTFIPPVQVQLSADDMSLCPGETTTITANASGGSSPYTYSWSTGSTASSIVAGVGTYYIDVLDTSGCYIATDSITIIQNPLPVVNAGPDQVVCDGEQVTLSASGASSYVWNNGVIDGVAFTPTVGMTTYTVTGTDVNGCTNTDQVDVTVNPLPAVNAGLDQTVCDGDQVTLSGSGASTYTWDNGVTDGVAFNQVVGIVTYTVTGTDINGCINTDQVDVTVNPLPVVVAGPDQTVCDGDQVTLSGSGASTYTWDNGVQNGVAFIPPLGTTTYTVTGTDLNGCINTDQLDVTVNPLPTVLAGPDQTVCNGDQVILAGSGASTYIWNNGVANGLAFIPSLGTTTFTVTGTDVNGCINTDQVNVTVNPLPPVNAGPDQEVCEGDLIVLNASGAQSYAWTNNVQNGVPFIPPVGTTIYSVTGTDANGCVNNDDLEVIVNPNPVVNAGPDQGACEGEKVTLTATGAQYYNWSGGIQNGVAFNPPIGSTNYVVVGTSEHGCIGTDTVNVQGWLNPIVSAEDAEICAGDPVILTGQGAVQYDWTDGIIDGQEFFPTMSKSYTVIGTDANGCTGEATATVTVHSLPIVNFKFTDPSVTTLDPTTGFINLTIGGQSYSWDFGDGSPIDNSFEPTHTFPDEGGVEYAITLSSYSEFGCYDEITKYIHIFQDYTIYVPNAFTPDNDDYNQVFKPVMEGFDPYDYSLFIYDRWGELVFESHDMEVGWDGTYAKQNFEVQQGTYTWKIVAGLEDSVDTKIFMGHVNLLK